jgi:hypothetical protein
MGDIGDIWRDHKAHRRAKKAGGRVQGVAQPKDHACDLCTRRFVWPEQLDQHRKDAHGIKPAANKEA